MSVRTAKLRIAKQYQDTQCGGASAYGLCPPMIPAGRADCRLSSYVACRRNRSYHRSPLLVQPGWTGGFPGVCGDGRKGYRRSARCACVFLWFLVLPPWISAPVSSSRRSCFGCGEKGQSGEEATVEEGRGKRKERAEREAPRREEEEAVS